MRRSVALTKKVGRNVRRALERAGKLLDDLDPVPAQVRAVRHVAIALDLELQGGQRARAVVRASAAREV